VLFCAELSAVFDDKNSV